MADNGIKESLKYFIEGFAGVNEGFGKEVPY